MSTISPQMFFQLPRLAFALALSIPAAIPISARAEELVVRITGLSAPFGEIGCSLFSKADGFPMDNSKSKTIWIPSASGSATCEFKGVEPGTYAVSVVHDVNGNHKVDTNFVGMPTEQWGVSNNARPLLRAPTFEEAVFQVVGSTTPVMKDIEVKK